MAETADFELVQAVRGMAGRISDPSARMTSKMDRSKQRRGLGSPMVKSKEVRTGTLTLASPSNVTIAFKAGSNIVQVLEDPGVVTVVQRC